MDLLGRKSRERNALLTKQNEMLTGLLSQKTSTPDIFWTKKGKMIALFDFSNDAQIRKAVLHVPELAATLNYLSTAFSSGIFMEFSNGEEANNSKIVELLKNPHPLYSGSYLKRYILEQLFSYGRCHLYMNTNLGRRENAQNISILEADKIKTYVGDVSYNDYLSGGEDIIKKYEYTFNNTMQEITDVENVVTLTWNTETLITGKYLKYISPLKPLEEALQVTPAMYDSMHNLMDNFGMIGFISNNQKDVAGSRPLDPKQQKEVEDEFQKFGTRKGQRRFSYINYPVEYTKVSSPLKEMMLPEQQRMIKTIIADVLNFDTALLNGDNKRGTLNGEAGSAYSESRKSMFTENLIPVGNNVTEMLSDYFYKFKVNTKLKLDFNHIDVFVDDERDMSENISQVSGFVIELNKAVADPENNMTRDNAIAVLTTNGYTEEEAQNLIS